MDNEQDQVSQNIAAVQEFYAREAAKLTRPQRWLERLSEMVGQPVFFVIILTFVVAWSGVDLLCRRFLWHEFDPAPFTLLQGIIGLCSLLTTIGVLSTQNRMSRLAEQRSNLDLKVMLLTEQKTAKLIDLLEELRRDLPNVKNRMDAHAESLQQSMNPSRVLEALDEHTDNATALDTTVDASTDQLQSTHLPQALPQSGNTHTESHLV
jgi:uncharacterized membrane protein